MTGRPVAFADVESCVEATISRSGRRIRLGTPLGLGKANHLVNEFFRRAQEDARLELRIFTAGRSAVAAQTGGTPLDSVPKDQTKSRPVPTSSTAGRPRTCRKTKRLRLCHQ